MNICSLFTINAMCEIDIQCSQRQNTGISKFENTQRLVCSGTKPFYYFWVKGFDIRRRDTILHAVPPIWPPSRAAPTGRKVAPRPRAPKVDPPRLASSFQLPNFLSILHKLLRASGAWRHSHSVTRFVSDYCDISEWHFRPLARARVNTCINVCT